MVDGLAAKANPDHQRQDHAPTAAPDPKRDEVAEENITTENDETTETPELEPEKGTEAVGDTQDSADTVDATTEPDTGTPGADGAEDVDWQSKADLYKAQMRKQEKRAKDNHAENEKLKAELDKLRQAEATRPPEPVKSEEKAKEQQDKPDPVLARMDEITAQLSELKAESEQLKAANAAAEHGKTVAEVANEKGLNADQAKFLQGKSREELEIAADEVIAAFGLHKTKSPGPAPKPKERKPQRGGASNPDDTDQRSPEDILAAVMNSGRRAKT